MKYTNTVKVVHYQYKNKFYYGLEIYDRTTNTMTILDRHLKKIPVMEITQLVRCPEKGCINFDLMCK